MVLCYLYLDGILHNDESEIKFLEIRQSVLFESWGCFTEPKSVPQAKIQPLTLLKCSKQQKFLNPHLFSRFEYVQGNLQGKLVLKVQKTHIIGDNMTLFNNFNDLTKIYSQFW